MERDGLYTVRSAYKMLAGEIGDLTDSSDGNSLHLFRDCGVARWVWDGLGIEVVTEKQGGDVKEWVEACWQELCVMESVKLMVGCWAIWEHRNKVIFDNVEVEPKLVIRRARDVILEGVGDSEGVGVRDVVERPRERERENGGWKVPRHGFVKINVDAGVKEGEGVHTGVVCRDCNGDVMWGVAVGREQHWEVSMAEAYAVLDGMEEVVRRGIQHVEVKSDCLQVI
ncbi:uncharacterized protein LOC141631420 [Silene latifolia]|uniref:uncharacterized protein LOC141631420 n=1 Tax=Silene latifolia TaxID=37657 RepID=UPI003D779CAA